MLVKKKINLVQLDQELNGKGLNAVSNNDGEIIEVTLTEHNDATEAELKAAIAAHVAVDEAKAKEVAKAAILDRIGLTADELKTILG
jgi:capsular polysaccharide biosynthesis protein